MSLTNDAAEQGPYELVLELLRARDADEHFPSKEFLFEPQEYIRRSEGAAIETARFGWGEEALADLEALQGEPMDWPVAERLGDRLSRLLQKLEFREDERHIEEALRAGRPVHLTLRAAAAELHALPWELVRVGDKAPGAQPRLLLRYEWPGARTAEPALDPPAEGGRILFAYSKAGGDVRVDRHLEVLRRACRQGHHHFDEKRDVVDEVSLGKLHDALNTHKEDNPVSVLHILCHGAEVPSAVRSYGLLWREGDRTMAIDAGSLRRALADHKESLRLVMLSVCHGGGQGDLTSRLGSVAQELHRLGIPAVVASRYPLSIRGSIDLTEVLYQKLLVESSSLEEAVLAARRRLHERPMKADWASLQLYARAADGSDHRPFVLRPYRGLLAFHEEHARYFFGRDREIEEAVSDLLRLVKSAARPERIKNLPRSRFLIVTGTSGTGKSSLVMAGVVPVLKGDRPIQSSGPRIETPRWEVAPILRPTREAMEELEQLGKALGTRRSEAPLLLVVDQFEEIFTVLSKEERSAFVRALWRLSGNVSTGVSVIVTLRVDYLARCNEVEVADGLTLESVAYDNAHRVFVETMGRSALQDIVERPAAMVGLELGDGLVDQILTDAENEPGALPLIEYTLDEMWRSRGRSERGGHELTVAGYRSLGAITGALKKKADRLIDELDEAQRRAAERLLVQLVDLREDATRDTRLRVRIDRLRRGPANETGAFDAVLQKLVSARLLVSSDERANAPPGEATADPEGRQPLIEIAHEQLVRSWDTLQGWLRARRPRELELRQLVTWIEDAKRGQELLTGSRLARANDLLQQCCEEIGDDARAFIQQSETAARRKEAIVYINGARNLLAKGKPVWAAKLLVALDPWVVAQAWDDAAREILDSALPLRTLRGHNRSVIDAAFSPDGRRIVTASSDGTARVWNADGQGEPLVLQGHKDTVVSARFSPDGQRILTRSGDGTARLWNADGQGETLVLQGRGYEISSAVYSPDGRRVLTTCRDETARVWNADGSGEAVVLRGHVKAVFKAAFSPDGQRVVTASEDGTARVWNADGSGEPVVLEGHRSMVTSAMFSPDSQRVVTASEDWTARVWNADGSGEPVVLGGRGTRFTYAMFSPDGQRIVAWGCDDAYVWDADGSGGPVVLKGHEDSVGRAVFSPNGQCVVTASQDGTARVWNADGKGESVVLRHESGVWSAAFSPDGRHIVTASSDGTARVWHADGKGEFMAFRVPASATGSAGFSPDSRRAVIWSLAAVTRIPCGTSAWVLDVDGNGDLITLRGHGSPVISALFSPDGERIVTASDDGIARVWNALGTDEPVLLQGHTCAIGSAVFSPDGERIVTASDDGTARVWNAHGRGEPAVLRGHEGKVNCAAFSPDGERIVTASDDGTARVWNADSTGEPAVLRHYSTGYRPKLRFAAFSPNGRRIVTVPDSMAWVWNADGRGLPVVLRHGLSDVERADFSRDGERIITTSPGGEVHVWNANGKGKPLVFRGHSAVFSQDGQHIVTLRTLGTERVEVWNADGQGEPVRFILKEHGSATLSRDGQRVLLVSSKGTARVHLVPGSPLLLERLHDADDACVPPEVRCTYLGETEVEV